MSPEREEILQFLRGLVLSNDEVARLLVLEGSTNTAMHFSDESNRVQEFHDSREGDWNANP